MMEGKVKSDLQLIVMSLHESLVEIQSFMSTRHNYIPVLGWEEALRQPIGISLDLFRFMLSLLFSLPIGAGIRAFRAPWGEKMRKERSPCESSRRDVIR